MFFPGAGWEEFVLGHRIIEYGKKNYVTKKTNYSTFYANLYSRCKTIIFRTSTYIPILISRKKFETKGAFATLPQALSTLLTSLTILSLTLYNFGINFKILILALILLKLIIEFNFLIFSMKYYKKKYLLIYIIGIYMINISIIIGTVIGIFRILSLKKLKL